MTIVTSVATQISLTGEIFERESLAVCGEKFGRKA
jgi:hypothetical protein